MPPRMWAVLRATKGVDLILYPQWKEVPSGLETHSLQGARGSLRTKEPSLSAATLTKAPSPTKGFEVSETTLVDMSRS